MTRILVTGGGGFLGRAIVEQLLERGEQVSTIARSDYPEIRELGATTFQGDLGERAALDEAFANQDVVIHTAAKAGVWGDRADFVRSNVTATENVIDACRSHGVRKLVFTSSPSVTFDGGDAKNAGNDVPYPDEFLAHYPETKAKAEQLVLAANGPDLLTTSLRPHLIWGPRDPHLVPRVVASAKEGKLKIVGDGQNVVDITYVDNAAVAHLQALDALTSHEAAPAGTPYFISDDAPVVLWDWINGVLGELGIAPVQKKVSPKMAFFAGSVLESAFSTFGLSGEPRMTRFVAQQLGTSHYYDMGPAKRDFSYKPLVDPTVGMQRLMQDLKARGL